MKVNTATTAPTQRDLHVSVDQRAWAIELAEGIRGTIAARKLKRRSVATSE